ncbi:MAG TPA: ATP-binding protein [Candidatus Saccharimonadales bacterium]
MKSLSLSKPHALIMVGIPGSGKTFFAKKFSETFSAPFVEASVISQHTSDNENASKLTKHFIDEILKTKQSIVIETTGGTRAERAEFAKHLQEQGYTPLLIWVQTDQDTARARLVRDKQDPAEVDASIRKFSPPHAQEKPLVISGKHTYATQAKVVLKRLSAPRSDISSHKQRPTRPGSIAIQ